MKKIEDGGCRSNRCNKGLCCKKYPTICIRWIRKMCTNRCSYSDINCRHNLCLWIDDTKYENKQS